MAAAITRANIFRAVADSTRRSILDLLADGELPMMALAGSFKMTVPAVSQHLRVLRPAGLVMERRCGRQRIYALQPEPLREISDWVGYYDRFWKRNLKRLREHLDRNP
ncbi:MAG TPA: metalloregulator ArsR/SmtB family transcription factor [Chthoniobacterales bacterium]